MPKSPKVRKTQPPDWRTGSGYPTHPASIDRWEYEFSLRGMKVERPSFDNAGIPPDVLQRASIDSPVSFMRGPLRIAPIAGTLPLPKGFANATHLCYVFLLDENIDVQIKHARKVLKANQDQFYKKKTTREIRGKWKTYLRFLDARREGASRAQIATVFFPKIDNTYPERKASRRVGDTLKAAKKLIKKGLRPRRGTK